jgi:hypothetical protein
MLLPPYPTFKIGSLNLRSLYPPEDAESFVEAESLNRLKIALNMALDRSP